VTDSNEPSSVASPDRVLVAESDDRMRRLLVGWLREAGYDVTECSSGSDLLVYLERSVLSGELPEFGLVLSDIPPGSMLDVLDEFFGCDGVPPTILIAAFGDRRARAMASHPGVSKVLEKPFDKDRLLAGIRALRDADPAATGFGARSDSGEPVSRSAGLHG